MSSFTFEEVFFYSREHSDEDDKNDNDRFDRNRHNFDMIKNSPLSIFNIEHI